VIKQYQALVRTKSFDNKVLMPSIREMKMLNAYSWTYSDRLKFIVETSIIRAQYHTIYDIWKQVIVSMIEDISLNSTSSQFIQYANILDDITNAVNSEIIKRPEV